MTIFADAMHGSIPLISTLASAFALALLCGLIAVRMRLPPIAGYLAAGVIIGPFTPGFVADSHLAGQLSEIGVMLLMFGVGLHFSPAELLSVRRIAVPGALGQIAAATLMGGGLAWLWGFAPASALVFGLSLSVASTVVLLRNLESLGLLASVNGRIAVGWLVVEDLAMVLLLVLLPPLAHISSGAAGGAAPGQLALSLALTLGKVGLFILLMLLVGAKFFPWLLWQVAKTGSRELFVLAASAAAIGIAFGAGLLFGVSFAIGAFFAGMVLRGSALSLRAASETLPLRDAFSVLFFVSVGMLLDPRVLLEHPVRVLIVLGIIIVGKSAAAFGIVLAFRYPANTALTVAASLAQIGEFSFILAAEGRELGLLSEAGRNLILAGAILSIIANSFIFRTLRPIQRWLERHRGLARIFERGQDPLSRLPAKVEPSQVTGHVVLVGYGRVGSRLAESLAAAGIPYIVAEQNREIVERLRGEGHKAVAGDAAEPEVLVQAHVARAAALVVAIPDLISIRKAIVTARELHPDIEIIARSHSEEAMRLLEGERVDRVFLGEYELAESMGRHLTERLRPDGPHEDPQEARRA
jgi:CPA2 family monovalent cation:H+ antiporter-2